MNRQEPGFSNAWLFAKEHAQPGSQDLDGRASSRMRPGTNKNSDSKVHLMKTNIERGRVYYLYVYIYKYIERERRYLYDFVCV